jgi:hypothetical protein
VVTKKKPESRAAAPDAQPDAAPLNREQRRAQKFGKAGKVHQHDPSAPWPENAANPALTSATEDQAAHAGRPDRAVTQQAGPGAGGSTETAEGTPEQEGMHGGNSTKG